MFTTRSMALCSKMGAAESKLRVEFLTKQHAWDLFYDRVGRKDLLESPSIRKLAEIVVSKCGGLPLALITPGTAMAHRETEEEWIHASQVLNRYPAEMKGMETVFSLLKLSYDNLDSNVLRSCFLYCTLFAEYYSIEIEQLVEYWIGEGFLTRSHGVNIIYEGYFLIGDLKAASLLETGDERTQVKMHNVVRSFALWMGNHNEVIVEPGMGLTEAPKAEKWRQALVISLLETRIQTLPEEPVCPNLTTLLLQQNTTLKKIPTGFFMHMPILRVLDLSFTSITEIPLSIKYFGRALSSSYVRNKDQCIASRTWESKKAEASRLTENSVSTNDPTRCHLLAEQARGFKLVLQLRGLGPTERRRRTRVYRLGPLGEPNHTRITVLSLKTLTSLYEFSALHKCIEYLHVEECHGLVNFDLRSLTNHGRSLRRPSIKRCQDLEYIVTPADTENDWLPNLEALTLQSLNKLSRVWRDSVSQECLQKIRCINISHCHKLKNISWVPQLPKLESIDLFDCREVEELISEHDSPSIVDQSVFPTLKTLKIRDLPELRNILPSGFSFQKLETLVITSCPKVKKLPFQESVRTNSPTVYCDEKWWDALENDQPNKELFCLPRFLPN